MNITGSTAARAVLSNAINNRATTREAQNTAEPEGTAPPSEEHAASKQAEAAIATTGSVGRQINLFA